MTKKVEKKLIIIKTALELFITRGYANVTTREISIASKISTGLLYNYFPSKEILFKEVVNWLTQKELCKHAEQMEKVEGPLEKLFESLRICIKDFENFQNLIILILDFIINTKEKLQIPEVLGGSYKIIREMDSQLIGKGYEKKGKSEFKVKADDLAVIISSFMDGLVIQKKVNPNLNIKQIMDSFITLLKLAIKQ